ncbi:alpha/beta hydrolase [Rathayibacter soli]|uniref:alpha/beta hydrolase n=1 Tax=Rathayibacter soli TaxID=3144168 RepID=UPI0027E59A11|nr:alpha/beta hydrolase [Glaciibacter superstes]
MWRTWPRRIAIVLCTIIAIVAISTAPPPGDQVVNTDLVKLLRMPAKQAAAYVKLHPQLYMDLENADPEATAKWWTSQTPKYQKKAIADWPSYIGNLEGIAYSTRDVANRLYLKTAYAKAKKAVAQHPGSPQAATTLQSLKAIKGALKGSRLSPRRYLVELTEDPNPLAAVAIGNPDTAKQVTFDVPGMGTYTTDMQLWTRSAVNVYEAQGQVGAPAARSVIAWIGYVTPPPGIDAALGEYAARGAVKLAVALAGLVAARNDDVSDLVLNIVAHSYGTTTAADALAELDGGVYAFVMLGSAGIEPWIPNAKALKTEYVYAGEAASDTEARLGQSTRIDPRAPSFGAIILPVDGGGSTGLLPVTGHAPVLHSPWNDNPMSSAWKSITNRAAFERQFAAHFKTYGYLDAGTQSLVNTAIATTPEAKQKFVR